jgi:hypothetical protein
VSTVVNAADAGRRGELIFDLVYTLARCPSRSNASGSRRSRARRFSPVSSIYSQRLPIGLRDSARCRQQVDSPSA